MAFATAVGSNRRFWDVLNILIEKSDSNISTERNSICYNVIRIWRKASGYLATILLFNFIKLFVPFSTFGLTFGLKTKGNRKTTAAIGSLQHFKFVQVFKWRKWWTTTFWISFYSSFLILFASKNTACYQVLQWEKLFKFNERCLIISIWLKKYEFSSKRILQRQNRLMDGSTWNTKNVFSSFKIERIFSTYLISAVQN